MFSNKAEFHNGQFYLDEPLVFQGSSHLWVTLLDSPRIWKKRPGSGRDKRKQTGPRKSKRYPAQGTVTLKQDNVEKTLTFFDYPSGGLSLLSSTPFKTVPSLKAPLKDPLDRQNPMLDFEFEGLHSCKKAESDVVGFKFTDDLDEKLLHSFMRRP